MSGPSLWSLEGFLEQFDLWAEREQPGDDLRIIVIDWIITRRDDPYRGVRREPGFENLWLGAIPDSDDGAGRVVVCSYWVFETEHRLRCNSYATLSLPI